MSPRSNLVNNSFRRLDAASRIAMRQIYNNCRDDFNFDRQTSRERTIWVLSNTLAHKAEQAAQERQAHSQ